MRSLARALWPSSAHLALGGYADDETTLRVLSARDRALAVTVFDSP
ncbi:hypothetical protein JOE63_002477 [Cellulosimicrobium cellulans]|nr:hypothetical protein [Cellulosimicrobium cellulans]MBM7820000.1 hypothetical protein [Cellulosimicrobium cellulans]